jgi:hypothetical protein
VINSNLKRSLSVIVILALVNILIVLTDSMLLRYPAALVLLCLLPGLAAVDLIFVRSRPPQLPDRIVLSIGTSYALSGLTTMAIHFIPGKINANVALITYDLLITFLLALRYIISLKVAPARITYGPGNYASRQSALAVSRKALMPLLVVLALSGFLRFTYLGYSEFQGDETWVMHPAVDAVEGKDDALFAHTKAPGEVLVPIAFWLIAGKINELGARFPFALASCLAVLAIYLLGRRMFNNLVGLTAAALLAINGFFVAFGRIVQYQALVFLMTILALYCYYRFYAGNVGGYQIIGALLLGFGLLAHYDAIVVLPAILYLYWAKYRSGLTGYRQHTTSLILSVILLISIVASFYLPFSGDPQFLKSFKYVSEYRMGDDILSNSFGQFLLMSTFYNSKYYFALIVLLLGIIVAKQLLTLPQGMYPCLVLLTIAMGSVFFLPHRWQIGNLNLAIAPFALILLALYAVPGTTDELKTALTWFAAPFIIYIFIVERPRTHVYNLYFGWALLGGVAVDNLRRWAVKLTLRRIFYGLGLGLYVISVYYIFFMFVTHTPEYMRLYRADPERRNRFYWTAHDQFPPHGYFGFPYRAGWKVIGQLYQSGALEGDYNSNEEKQITAWYMRYAPRTCSQEPKYYFIAKNVQDVQEVAWDVLKTHYALIGTVLVGDDPKLQIYQRRPVHSDAQTYRVEDYQAAYDATATLANFMERPAPQHPLIANLGGQVQLLGFDLDAEQVAAGEVLRLTLYWRGLSWMPISYRVFCHLETDRIWGQADGVPGCWNDPTTEWRPDRIVTDRHDIPIDPQTPSGQYPLLIGMYEPETGQRLEVLDETGTPQRNSVPLIQITVTRREE